MRSRSVLLAVARRLNQERGSPDLPCLYFLTDPWRTPDPVAVARRLPAGAAVIYRHFGAPERAHMARALAEACRRRLVFLIAADPELAARVGADGVHWPQRLLPPARTSGGLITASAHGAEGLVRAAAVGVDACLLGPVFPSRSSAGRKAMGIFRASQLARSSTAPVIALGGVGAANARLLPGRGFAGLAAIDGLSGSEAER